MYGMVWYGMVCMYVCMYVRTYVRMYIYILSFHRCVFFQGWKRSRETRTWIQYFSSFSMQKLTATRDTLFTSFHFIERLWRSCASSTRCKGENNGLTVSDHWPPRLELRGWNNWRSSSEVRGQETQELALHLPFFSGKRQKPYNVS
jgi:hypothetical protein